MNIHPVAHIFPDMTPIEYRSLVDDIRKNGLLEPIWVDADGLVLDGRHRIRACEELGIDCASRVFTGSDPVSFVVSLNLNRRSLNKSQVSMCAARAEELREKLAEEAKERQRARKGNQPGTTMDQGPYLPKLTTRDAIGAAFGISGKSVERAVKVLTKSPPEVIQAVDEGKVSVRSAVKLADEPADVQIAALSKERRSRLPEHKETDPSEPKLLGVGLNRAAEAINALRRIPKNDALRASGLQLVSDWIRKNK